MNDASDNYARRIPALVELLVTIPVGATRTVHGNTVVRHGDDIYDVCDVRGRDLTVVEAAKCILGIAK